MGSSILLFYTPGRVFAILAGVKETDLVAVGVFQVGLPPEPRAVGWVFVEVKSKGFKAFDFRIQILAFEVKCYFAGAHTPCGPRFCLRWISDVDGKGGVAVRAFETGVAGQRIDDQVQAELLKKLDCLYRFVRVNGDLI